MTPSFVITTQDSVCSCPTVLSHDWRLGSLSIQRHCKHGGCAVQWCPDGYGVTPPQEFSLHCNLLGHSHICPWSRHHACRTVYLKCCTWRLDVHVNCRVITKIESTCPKKTYQWPTGIWKGARHHLPSGKCQSKPQVLLLKRFLGSLQGQTYFIRRFSMMLTVYSE